MGEEEGRLVVQVLDGGTLTGGPLVEEFERRVAAVVGARYAVAVSSGTAALHLALMCLEVGAGDEVIVPDYTFPASANAVRLCGATAVLCDIDPSTFNLDPDDAARRVTSRTKAIMPVHLFGLPADMDAVLALAREHRLRVVEDAACALGATYRGHPCGALGDVGCFSFHPRKIITTAEGGMLVTNDDRLAERARALRNHGMRRQAEGVDFLETGYNYRLSEVHAALGVAQMARLPDLLRAHRQRAAWYGEELADIPGVALPGEPPGCQHIYQAYVVRLDERFNRDRVISRLRAQGVEASIGTYALSALSAYRDQTPLPRARRVFQQALALPLDAHLTREEVRAVARALRAALNEELECGMSS
ncbi:MAG: DegT/DnrJ/EryC1/StrS family aminotransferase [Abditibacteriales bacterium]|nr:DegT/DnrJ/EryC1/StrS family aminotransferase [Abditibacteriales bacterium]MDW8364264.1 DegT/DnrJ/EryC1/StrS family aminotransferase [Abditibacteriales bacterium]